MGYVPKDTCTFCKVDSETALHLFYECPSTNLFFKKKLKTFGLHPQMWTKSFCNETCSLGS